MTDTFLVKPSNCLSTHGGSGYAPGSYWNGNAIVCGFCGTKIENPPPTGKQYGVPIWRGIEGGRK